MREMKDSGIEWIGEIPENWKCVRLKYTVKQCTERSNDSMGYIGLEHIESGSGRKIKKDDDLLPDGIAIKIQKNDVLFGKLRPYLSKSYLVQQNGCCSTEFVVMRPIDIDSRFLKYITLTSTFVDSINISTYGAKMPRANWDYIGNIFVPLPNMGLQIHIADYLDRKCSQIDAIIARQQEVIDKLKAYKLSVTTEAVTKGLNPDVPMKDSGVEWIGEIPEHWSIVPLTKQLESIIDYRGKTPEKVDDGIFLVTARNIKNGMIDYSISSEYVKAEDYNEIMRRGIPQIGDVLFTTEAPLGQVANVDRTDIALAQRIIKFSTKKHLDSYFLKYWIMSVGFQNFLMTLSTGSTAVGIKASKLFMLPVPLAPMQEQKQIVTYLDKKCERIESVIDRKQALIDKFTDYKKSLIYEVVTGKKEV